MQKKLLKKKGILKHIKKVYATDVVAVGYTGDQIPNFEKTGSYWIYSVDKQPEQGDKPKVTRMQMLSLYSEDLDEIIQQMNILQVDAIICKNFGPKAMSRLKKAGFRLYSFEGGAGAAVNAFAKERLGEL